MAARRKKKTSKKTSKSVALTRVNRGELALPADLEDEFAPFMNRAKATATETGWAFISTEGSTPTMKLGDQPVGDETGVRVIVLGATYANLLYEGDYVPGQPSGVACYAIADPNATTEEEIQKAVAEMGPPSDLKTAKSEKCSDCVYNAWGSGKGQGKACKNTVKLAAVGAGSDYEKATGFMVSVPPVSLKPWAAYANHVLNALARPVQSVVTKIKKNPNEKTSGFTFSFDEDGILDSSSPRGVSDLRAILGRAKGEAITALASAPMIAESKDKVGASAAPRRKVVRKKRGAKK